MRHQLGRVGGGCTEVGCVTNWVGWGGWGGCTEVGCVTKWVGGGCTEVGCVTNWVGWGAVRWCGVTSLIGTLPVEYQLRPPLIQVYRTHTRPYTVCTLLFMGFNIRGFGWISSHLRKFHPQEFRHQWICMEQWLASASLKTRNPRGKSTKYKPHKKLKRIQYMWYY